MLTSITHLGLVKRCIASVAVLLSHTTIILELMAAKTGDMELVHMLLPRNRKHLCRITDDVVRTAFDGRHESMICQLLDFENKH